jgi:hypothetical protein
MNAGSTNCFQIKVHTTNGVKDTFNIDGEYYDCEQGFVYVMADTIEEAARAVPTAIEIRRIGFGVAWGSRPPGQPGR